MWTSICASAHLLPIPFDEAAETDKLRIDYIESEMAKRHLGKPTSTSVPDTAPNSKASKSDLNFESASPQVQALERQPASVGKIHEIDLGQDVSALNERRTELAMRRARGEDVPAETAAPVKKVRHMWAIIEAMKRFAAQ